MTVIHLDRREPGLVLEDIMAEFENGRPVILPTDTLYGIGAPISDHSALRRIFELKSRPLELTLPIALGNLKMVDETALVRSWQRSTLGENLPGPVTFILEARENLDPLVVRNGTIAVRVPGHPLFIPLTTLAGPIALTSANRHGGSEFLNASEIDREWAGELLIIEDDTALAGKASAVLDITRELPTVLREGNLNMDELMGEKHGG